MKTLSLLTLLLFTSAAHADCLSRAKADAAIASDSSGPQRLCKSAIDDGPMMCYLQTAVSVSTADAITLCIGSTQNNYLVPISCYNQTSLQITNNASVKACSGAHNSAPANCANLLVRMTDIHGNRLYSNDEIAAISVHSVNTEETIQFFNDLVYRQKKSVTDAIKAAAAYNEYRY